MYLKSLELVGFKSFADKTKVDIDPGLTCIVGPNGCGKSNVSDAIRWVLGEQSAKALRGGKMEDCIFNGTDTRKPLGMAEVSITMADCEGALNTEYHEVTVTRRVFRSGEGQYFINKTPCRLKDVQRLFMDTGIGTTSYSVMEQGRIDRVLSSRPEDRREIFEEASGITKYKADKKEAIRKLEHTEANLLRLADVIREVKRQIGSLQRQAGKARRYKEIRDELKKFDVYATKMHIHNADNCIRDIESKISALNTRKNTVARDIEEIETQNTTSREALLQIERDIGTVMESASQSQSKLDHTHEMITLNHQRIQEYRNLSERDSGELDEIQRQLTEKQTQLAELTGKCKSAATEENAARQALDVANAKLADHQQQIDSARKQINRLREESVELESTSSKLRNQMLEIETRERSSVIQRERLAAEKTQMARIVSNYEEKQQEMTLTLTRMRDEVTLCETALRDSEKQAENVRHEIQACQQELATLKSKAAAGNAKIEMLADNSEAESDFPGGARLLLDPVNPLQIDAGKLWGSLASHITARDGYATALEATLRAWLDAVVVADKECAHAILVKLESAKKGSVRLLTAETAPRREDIDTDIEGLSRLIDHVNISENIKPLINRLIGNVFVVESITSIPSPMPKETAFVTLNGSLVADNGCMEFWMNDPHASNPLSRKNALSAEQQQVNELSCSIDAAQNQLNQLLEKAEDLNKTVENSRTLLDKSRHVTSQKEGELQVTSRESTQSREHLSVVSYELDNLNTQEESSDNSRQNIALRMSETKEQQERVAGDIQIQTKELQKLEERHSELIGETTEQRVTFSSISQRRENLQSQHDAIKIRIAELDAGLKGRSEGVESYKARIHKLTEEISQAESHLADLEESVVAGNVKAERMRSNRETMAATLESTEKMLSEKRLLLEDIRNSKSEMDIRLTETRMRRQNTIERATAEYSLTVDNIMEEAEPEWENGTPPPLETIETTVAELKTKLDAMGSVNLVAIEEYKELEDRYNFLSAQEEDLVKSKQQLIDMIRQINKTTSEMFRSTFDQVNINFQEMYKKLFDGGSAKLVLINEEDVLECGIEIIARPPGKRLQNISLLSGGERTLTAVSLLLAIYMIKPSPFCLLDELDAALDDSNIGRFTNVLKGFLNQSQFLIITHNQHTIAASNAIYGITMPEKGVSTIVSMRFKEAAKIAG